MSGRPSIIAGIVTALLGLLMVSNVKYYSFKDISSRGRVPFVAMLALVLVFGIIAINPPLALMSMSGVYALSGLVLWLFSLRKVSSGA